MDPGPNEINASENARGIPSGTEDSAPENSGTTRPTHSYNLRNLPERETIRTHNTSNAGNQTRRLVSPYVRPLNNEAQGNNRQQPSMEELPGRNIQRQLNLEGVSRRNNQQQPLLLSGRNDWQQIPGEPGVYFHGGQIPQISIFRQPNLVGLPGRNNQQQPNLAGLPGRNNQQQPNLATLPGRNNQQQPNLAGLPGRNNQQLPILFGLPGRNNQQQSNLDGLPGRNNQQQPNLAGLPGRNNQQLPNLFGLPGRNNQQQPNLAGHMERNHQQQPLVLPEINDWQQIPGVPGVYFYGGQIPQINIFREPNLARLLGRINQQQPNLAGLPGRNNQQQPNLQRLEIVDEQPRNHQREDRAITYKLATEEIPEAELDDTQCAICLRSAREYKQNRRPVARTDCGHFFCLPCIFKWKKTSRNCPYCRQQIFERRGSRGLYLFHVI